MNFEENRQEMTDKIKGLLEGLTKDELYKLLKAKAEHPLKREACTLDACTEELLDTAEYYFYEYDEDWDYFFDSLEFTVNHFYKGMKVVYVTK